MAKIKFKKAAKAVAKATKDSKILGKKDLSKRALDIISDLRLLEQIAADKTSLLTELVEEMGGKLTFDLDDGLGPWTVMLPEGREPFWRTKPERKPQKKNKK